MDDDFENDFLRFVKEAESQQSEDRLAGVEVVFLVCRDIYAVQDPTCPLWIACNSGRVGLAEAYRDVAGSSWTALIRSGLNANFMTRRRWLDVDAIADVLQISLAKLVRDLRISDAQVRSWKLSPAELSRLNPKRHGPPSIQHLPASASSTATSGKSLVDLGRMACIVPRDRTLESDSDDNDDDDNVPLMKV